MICPYCPHDDSKVIDSRDSGDGVRRRRECFACGRRFTTYERIHRRAMTVVKRAGRREDFDRDKLYASVIKACAKRPLPVGGVEKAVGEIEKRLAESGRAETPSRAVGELVMETLADLDQVAYIRFASVYLDFENVETFKTVIDDMLDRSQEGARRRKRRAPRKSRKAIFREKREE